MTAVLASLAVAAGCARTPQDVEAGTRLIVQLRFAGPVNDNYHYYVLIRNAADPLGQNGPIPVIEPPYGNGFATGRNTATAGFTDFVEYGRGQPQPMASGYGVYHVPRGVLGDPNRGVFVARGEPDSAHPPLGGTTLRFELGLDRLAPDAGEPDPNDGQTPRFLQVNVVATTTRPSNPVVIDPDKVVDAFGDRTSLGSGFITLDTAQAGRVYQSNQTPGDPFFEPEGDPYPSDRDPAIDLVAWSIEIAQR